QDTKAEVLDVEADGTVSGAHLVHRAATSAACSRIGGHDLFRLAQCTPLWVSAGILFAEAVSSTRFVTARLAAGRFWLSGGIRRMAVTALKLLQLSLSSLRDRA
ncbi:MAG: hypothetical protein ACR2JT_04780, partial [Nocardioidaceae bacterium]